MQKEHHPQLRLRVSTPGMKNRMLLKKLICESGRVPIHRSKCFQHAFREGSTAFQDRVMLGFRQLAPSGKNQTEESGTP